MWRAKHSQLHDDAASTQVHCSRRIDDDRPTSRSVPMPSLPKPRLRRSARSRGDVVPRPPEPESPDVEIVEAARPALDQHRAPARRSTARGWRSTSTSTPSTTRTSSRATSARRSTSTTTTCSSSCTSRATTSSVGRLNAAELDIFVGPDFLITLPNEPLQPVEYLFERCRTQRGAARAAVLQGPRLPALQDRRRLRRRLVPDAAQDGQQARAHRGGHLRGRAPTRSCATSPTSSRRSSTSARSSARSASALRDLERTKRATSPRTSTSTSTTSTTRPSASGTCSRTTRRSSRRSRPPTSR